MSGTPFPWEVPQQPVVPGPTPAPSTPMPSGPDPNLEPKMPVVPGPKPPAQPDPSQDPRNIRARRQREAGQQPQIPGAQLVGGMAGASSPMGGQPAAPGPQVTPQPAQPRRSLMGQDQVDGSMQRRAIV